MHSGPSHPPIPPAGHSAVLTTLTVNSPLTPWMLRALTASLLSHPSEAQLH